MSTNMVGKVRRARKVDPNGNIYYDRGISDVIFDPVRGTSVKEDIDRLRDGLTVALAYVAANPKGMDGLSAYEIAKEHGFEGTEYEWVQSLKGVPGADGLSAYELACTYLGFEGTMKEYLESLKGEKGDKGDSNYDIAVRHGYTGSEEDWVDTMMVEPITDETILAMYARITGNPIQGGDDYTGLIETINALGQKIGTMDDALQETMVDVQIDDDSVLTGYKTNGTEFQRKLFDTMSEEDVREVADKVDDIKEGEYNSDIAEAFDVINQRLTTIDDTLQDTMTDVQIDNESSILTGYKTSGEEFQRKLFELATEDDVNNMIDNAQGGEDNVEEDA